jgi:hypothetical protein
MMALKRTLTEAEKKTVRDQQSQSDGTLRCFISGEIIHDDDETEFDHIHPYSKDGETSVANIRITLKRYNRRKSDQSLYDVRDNLRLERLFADKRNSIRLQDILQLKDISKRSHHAIFEGNLVRLTDGSTSLDLPVFHDDVLQVRYFYGRIPIAWIENDDQEGLQPRVIDYKRLIAIRDHLKSHPQLAPSIGRLIGGRLKLFDGQHKLAAQVLNNRSEMDIKVYVSPDEVEAAKRLFDDLMFTNLEAHSKLKQIGFYTSTMLDRLSVIQQEYLSEFIAKTDPADHTEQNFVSYMSVQRGLGGSEANAILSSATISAALNGSALSKYVATASKDPGFPITVDLLQKTIFRSMLYLKASVARFQSADDHRDAEAANFGIIAQLLVEETGIENWVQNVKGKSLSDPQVKARRIWHKGAVLTWAPYLRSILCFGLSIMTNNEREQMLYRHAMTHEERQRIKILLNRLFSHPLWDDPSPEIDSLLVSAQKQDDLFKKHGLTEHYVLYGQ